jgi:hypothetical protein
MKLFLGTNVTTTGDVQVTKGIASLKIATTKQLSELDNETISVWVEKSKGNNKDLLVNVNLRAFMCMSSFGAAAIYAHTTGGTSYVTVAVCELTNLGAIALEDNESIKFRIDNIDNTAGPYTWLVTGFEEPMDNSRLYKYDTKTISADDTTRIVQVGTADLLHLSSYTTLTGLVFTFDNDQQCRYDVDDLRAIQMDTDPVMQITSAGAIVPYSTEFIIVPLVAVRSIEFIKPSGTRVDIVLRSEI